jgi:hypothetical protein
MLITYLGQFEGELEVNGLSVMNAAWQLPTCLTYLTLPYLG